MDYNLYWCYILNILSWFKPPTNDMIVVLKCKQWICIFLTCCFVLKLHQNFLSKCLEAKEKSVTQLNEEGEELIEQNHPGKNVIGVITSHLLENVQSKTSSGGCHRHHGMSFVCVQCITVLHYRVVWSNYDTKKTLISVFTFSLSTAKPNSIWHIYIYISIYRYIYHLFEAQ